TGLAALEPGVLDLELGAERDAVAELVGAIDHEPAERDVPGAVRAGRVGVVHLPVAADGGAGGFFVLGGEEERVSRETGEQERERREQGAHGTRGWGRRPVADGRLGEPAGGAGGGAREFRAGRSAAIVENENQLLLYSLSDYSPFPALSTPTTLPWLACQLRPAEDFILHRPRTAGAAFPSPRRRFSGGPPRARPGPRRRPGRHHPRARPALGAHPPCRGSPPLRPRPEPPSRGPGPRGRAPAGRDGQAA